jgi:hypothetical protein
MRDENTRLICAWVPVVDAAGRTHMEARWTPAATGHRAAA